jgi:hypothetical protein
MAISRRDFVRYGITGLAVLAGDRWIPMARVFHPVAHALDGEKMVELVASEAFVEMVDLTPVYHWVWEVPGLGPSLPGPTIRATEGEQVTIRMTNALREEHAFALVSGPEPSNRSPLPTVPGPGFSETGLVVPGTFTGPVPPGGAATITFEAPAAGTYIYLDPLNGPVNRALGLHGMFISLPQDPVVTPYTQPTGSVLQLFQDFGRAEHLPGYPWNLERTWLWIFFSIDPKFNARAFAGEPIPAAEFRANNVPQYFMVSGRTGFFASHDPLVFPFGYEGNPALIRNVNVGMATHSPHIHGNHVYLTAFNGEVQANVLQLSTWAVPPLAIADVVLPFIKPPDIPPEAWPPVDEPFPMRYPMHCHVEMSQLASGANYPQGLVTDWDLEGPLGPLAGGPESYEGDPQFIAHYLGPDEGVVI